MTFDIHRSLVDEEGEINYDAATKFEEELVDLFADSPEAEPVLAMYGCLEWADCLLSSARTYERIPITTMDWEDLEVMLLDVFPCKILCEPSDALAIVTELRAFFGFLHREFALPNADVCAGLLDDELTRQLELALSNPENYGLAKMMVIAGTKAGFDMTSEEGIAAFVEAYNQSLPRMPVRPPLLRLSSSLTRSERNKKKAARKARRNNRRKSR